MTVTYKYDADGLRTQKTVNGVVYNYGYENGKLVYERKGNEYEVIYRYDADGNLFTVNRCIFSSGYTSLLYAVNNTRGDVVALYKGGGGRYSTYTYDSWGKPVVEATGMSAENSVRYRGYVYDQETGLYYLQSRYYDPETGRFLNADDVDYIGYSGEDISYNAFAYCENNAVCRLDCSGFSVFYDFFKNIKLIMEILLPIYNMSNFAVANSSVADSINLMKHISQTIHFNRKYNLYTVNTVAETYKWNHTERYSIITYSAKKIDWENIITVVNGLYNDRMKETVKSKAKALISGILSSFKVLQFIGYITLAAESVNLTIDVFLMVLCEETLPIIKKGLKRLSENEYYTFNWYVKYEYKSIYGNQTTIIYDYYSKLAYYLGVNNL